MVLFMSFWPCAYRLSLLCSFSRFPSPVAPNGGSSDYSGVGHLRQSTTPKGLLCGVNSAHHSALLHALPLALPLLLPLSPSPSHPLFHSPSPSPFLLSPPTPCSTPPPPPPRQPDEYYDPRLAAMEDALDQYGYSAVSPPHKQTCHVQ